MQVDRSPCGSGVSARTAVQYHKGLRKLGQSCADHVIIGACHVIIGACHVAWHVRR